MTLSEVKLAMQSHKTTTAIRDLSGWHILAKSLPLEDPHITTEVELAQDDAEILPALVDGQPFVHADGRENLNQNT